MLAPLRYFIIIGIAYSREVRGGEEPRCRRCLLLLPCYCFDTTLRAMAMMPQLIAAAILFIRHITIAAAIFDCVAAVATPILYTRAKDTYAVPSYAIAMPHDTPTLFIVATATPLLRCYAFRYFSAMLIRCRH